MTKDGNLYLAILAAIVTHDGMDRAGLIDFVDYVEKIRITEEELNKILCDLECYKVVCEQGQEIYLKQKHNGKIKTINDAKKVAGSILSELSIKGVTNK